MSFIAGSFVSLKRAESLKKGFGGKAQVASGVDTELINMSPRFEKEIGADVAAAGPEHYYGSDQSSFYSVYRELTRAKCYSLPANVPGSPGKLSPTKSNASPTYKPSRTAQFEDVLAGDEVEARYRDLHELEATEEDGASLDESDPFGRHAAVEEDKYDHPQAIGDEAAAEKHPLRRRIDGLHLPRLQVADAADGPQFSARSLFLAECVDKDLQPRAGFLLRKMRSTEINMAQLGVGERLARAFACCVGKLPNLLHLDMSYNYLGDRTMAEADCAIEELETADCHLDDDDVALFLERALRNRNLVLSRWNLAKNSIGSAVDHAPAASDRPSLASWIGSDECTCKRLDISWNMIRGSVAVALGKALSTNHCVTHLNLAFNSLAEEGVVFGNSLLKNRVLKVLDLSNNGLGPKAAFAMSVALLGRMSALELLVMDGNPVGVTGGQALLRVLTRMDHRAHLSLRDCSFHGGSIGERWIINDDYTLDLSVPILYCLARDILQGDATRPCPPIDCCYLTPPGGASQRIRTKIEWTGARARPSTGDAYDEAHSRALDNVVTRLASLDRDELLDFFPHRDGDDVPFLYRRELDALLEHLGLVEYVTERTADGSGFARTPRHALADTLPLVDNWSQLKATGRLEIGEFMQVAGARARRRGGRFVVFDEATGEDFAQTLPEAGAFIRAMLPKSTNRSRLQRAMGQRFQLLIDMPAGHYTLRLDKMEEREVLVALLQANRFERHRVHGNRSGFRNETLDGSAVEICDELLDGLGPSPKGLLEFDFAARGEAAEDDGDKAAQDSLMEAQQKLAQAMPDVGKGGAAGGDHRRSTYKPRVQSINAVSQDTAERFKSWFKGEEGGRRKPATPDTDEPTPDGTPSATPKATTRSVGKKPASPALGGGSEMLRASSKSGKSKLNKLKTIARMMISGAGAAKSAADTELILARLNEFHLLLAGCWFSAAQACTLLRRWQLFDGPKLRNRDVLKLLRPQVELVIMLHSRVVDLYNIDEVFAVLDPTMRAEAIFRLGTLNIWSPLKPDGPYSLNLGLREDRQVVRMLVHLHEAEQAVWRNPTLRWKLDMPRVEGWSLPTTWLNQDGIPRSGHVAFTYDPQHEDWSTRIVLAALTLAGVDEDDDDLLSEMPQSEPLEAMLAASLDAAHIKWVYDGITVADPVPRRPKDLPGGRDSLIQAKSRSATPEA
ncbi:cysteine-type endopeptidase inhibitor [Aureococcus anophagefferens]|uniref:Cysteine-type endopeptidase inhibitor n=1 Tax=Aureococcus anophagefferens TaxID=44056 RepID=A0ABR1GCV8_AURAN